MTPVQSNRIGMEPHLHTYFTMFHRLLVRGGLVLLCAMATAVLPLAQDRIVPRRSIGNVTTHGNFIILTLDENALGKSHWVVSGKITS